MLGVEPRLEPILLGGATVFGLIRVDALGSADHAFEAIVLAVIWLAARAEAPNSVPSSSPAPP